MLNKIELERYQYFTRLPLIPTPTALSNFAEQQMGRRVREEMKRVKDQTTKMERKKLNLRLNLILHNIESFSYKSEL